MKIREQNPSKDKNRISKNNIVIFHKGGVERKFHREKANANNNE